MATASKQYFMTHATFTWRLFATTMCETQIAMWSARTLHKKYLIKYHGSNTPYYSINLNYGFVVLNVNFMTRNPIEHNSFFKKHRRSTESVDHTAQCKPNRCYCFQVPNYDRELLVKAHTQARIPCELKNVTNLRWYKDNEVSTLNLLKHVCRVPWNLAVRGLKLRVP